MHEQGEVRALCTVPLRNYRFLSRGHDATERAGEGGPTAFEGGRSNRLAIVQQQGRFKTRRKREEGGQGSGRDGWFAVARRRRSRESSESVAVSRGHLQGRDFLLRRCYPERTLGAHGCSLSRRVGLIIDQKFSYIKVQGVSRVKPIDEARRFSLKLLENKLSYRK